MTTITSKYIRRIYHLTQTELPESAFSQAKRCLLDYLGVTLAGSNMLHQKGSRFLDESGMHDGNLSVIGFNTKSNLYHAALINGMCAHVAELDDGVRQGSIHPGASVISSLFPLAQQYKTDGKSFLKGMVIGYEAAILLANSIQPSHRNKGYHATGTCGTIGVAIGAAAMLGFTEQQMKNALSAAATSASGMLHIIKGSSELKPYNAGQAAVSGLAAALIARSGFNGSDHVLDGDRGFIKMMTDQYHPSYLKNQPEDKLWIEKVYFKPYAACRHCHPAIEAALALKNKHRIKPEQIKEIKIFTYELAVDERDHSEIKGITSAKMSTPFSVAVALTTGKAMLEEFTEEKIKDPFILALAKKISVTVDEQLNLLVPEKRAAIVHIITYQNKEFTYRTDLAKGEPENPLTETEIIEKFISLSMFGGKSYKDASQMVHDVENIEKSISRLRKRINPI